MTDAYGRKHHSLQIKEKHSKGGTLTGLLLKLFNWNGWLLKKGIPKKLPSAERSQVSKSGGKDERTHILPRLLMIPDEKDASSAAITRTNYSYNMVQAMPIEDGINLRKPGVVARLMGLDYIPCSPSKKVNGEVHRQTIPTVAPSGKRQHVKSKDVNLTAKSIEKSSKKVVVNKQLRQRQLARSLDINLQKTSKTSFLNFASKPLMQREDIARVSNSSSESPHRSRGILAPSKPVDKLRSTQNNSQSKGATLLLEAAVKTLEPSLRFGDHDRPVLVQALASRTDPERHGDKRMPVEKFYTGKYYQNHTTGGIPEKGSVIISSIQVPSHKKVPRSLAEKEVKQASPAVPQMQKAPTIQATENLSDHYQNNKMDVCVMKRGHHGQLELDTQHNKLNPKSKTVKEAFEASRQFHNQTYHKDVEEASTYDKQYRTGHERTPKVTVKNPFISSKSEIANTKLSQLQHEDYDPTVRLIQLNAEKNLESKPQMAEISQIEKVSSLRNIRPSKDRRFEQSHKEALHWKQEESVVRGVSMVQAIQEKPPARRALADFSQQRNQKFSNTKRKSLSETSTEKHLQKSCELISTSEGTNEPAASLASCTGQSLIENRSAVSQELSSEGQCADDDSLNNVDLLGSDWDNQMTKPCEAVLNGKSTEQSQQNLQISKTEIQLCTPDNLCAKHEDRELPYGRLTGYALKDDDLEDILRSMLYMTIANDSLNEKEHQNDDGLLPKGISKDFIARNDELEGRAEDHQPEDPRAPSLSLEIRSTPSEKTATTPRCAERVLKPDNVEDSGQPSPVSVLELPFEDEDICSSWRGEEYPVTVMDEVHTRRALAPTDNNKFPSTYKRNLLANFNACNREMAREAILNNLKQHFLHLFPDEEKENNENNEMECMQYKAVDGKATDASCLEKMSSAQHQQLRQFATAKTCVNKEGHLSKPSEASKFYDNLLSDCAKEVLTPKLSLLRYADIWSQPSYIELTGLGRQIVDEAYKQITIWSQLNLSTINDLVDRDLSILAENWTDFQNEIDETGAKLESIIFNATLDELVYDLLTSNTTNIFTEIGNSIHCDNSLIHTQISS